ncbi:hypothetical protein LXL04_033045 [Taraxacum kok-saghyz]
MKASNRNRFSILQSPSFKSELIKSPIGGQEIFQKMLPDEAYTAIEDLSSKHHDLRTIERISNIKLNGVVGQRAAATGLELFTAGEARGVAGGSGKLGRQLQAAEKAARIHGKGESHGLRIRNWTNN